MLYSLHESGHSESLMVIEADDMDSAWNKAHMTGIQNKSNIFKVDEL